MWQIKRLTFLKEVEYRMGFLGLGKSWKTLLGNDQELRSLFADGWEPFSVTTTNDPNKLVYHIWLRKEVEK